MEHVSGTVVYRLDWDTGEVCTFGFPQRTPPVDHGCVPGSAERTPDRYAMGAVHGARGTSQSSAFRLDRSTGEVCRIRLTGEAATLGLSGCIGSSQALVP